MVFMSSHFNQTVVNSFQNLPLPVMKADFFRLAIMYYEGGIYADVDVQCNKPIQIWDGNADNDQGGGGGAAAAAIDKCEVILGMENDCHVLNWAFASRKNHPLFQQAMDLSLSRFVNMTIDLSQEHFVHETTGPRVFTLAVKDIAKDVGCVIPNNDNNDTKTYAKDLYRMCRDVLKEKYGLCLYDQQTQESWFKNHYSSQKKELQSENWLSSWTEEREMKVNEFKLKTNENSGVKVNE